MDPRQLDDGASSSLKDHNIEFESTIMNRPTSILLPPALIATSSSNPHFSQRGQKHERGGAILSNLQSTMTHKLHIPSPFRIDENAEAPLEMPTSSNLGEKLFGDVLVATGVTFAVAPFISIVDKAIVQKVAGTHNILQSVAESTQNMVRKPVQFIKSPMFLLMWGMYAATYSTANVLKTLVEHREQEQSSRNGRVVKSDESSSNAGTLGIFAGTATVNSVLTLYKERAYAQIFGTSGAATKIPKISYALWATRDWLVIGSSFVLPDIVSVNLQETWGLREADASKISQLACPVVTQLVASPLQLLGLDFYNRSLSNISTHEAFVERCRFLAQNYTSIVVARIARIAPAYGIGGIGNTYFRNAWRSSLIHREISRISYNKNVDELRHLSAPSRLVRLATKAEIACSDPQRDHHYEGGFVQVSN
eukprot:scaffold56037_cov45-Attheya_sp.AAC.2